MLSFDYATRSDIEQFYGHLRESIKAVCVKRDGIPVGMVGLALESIQARFFCEDKDMTCAEMCKSWRAVKMAMRLVRASHRPVVSIAESDHGHKNLTRLGFIQVEGDYYIWSGN